MRTLFSASKSCYLLATLCLLAMMGLTDAQTTGFQATDFSFTVQLPADFGPAEDPPAGAILAVEIPGRGISLFCSKEKAEQIDQDILAEQLKRRLYDNGAQIYGKAKATLGGKPAASFLVGGIKPGKESLFVYNSRPDSLYVFVLNYPKADRQLAAKMWNQMAPTFKFVDKKAKKH